MRPPTRLSDHAAHGTETRQRPLLDGRACLCIVLLCVVVIAACSVERVSALQITTATPRASVSTLHFPDGLPLPAGLVEQGSGSRQTVSEIAGAFRNSRDAAQLLANWGWLGNVYRSYVAAPDARPGTPARIEISLHQFHSSTGAAYALPYLAHDRAVALHQQEELGGFLRPCASVVLGEGEATQFLRSGALLVRVTVIMPDPSNCDASALALRTATDLALAVISETGVSPRGLSAGCP